MLGLPVVHDIEWTETAVRKVLNTLCYGGHPSDDQISAWSEMEPQQAIVEILTFDKSNEKVSPAAVDYPIPATTSAGGSLYDTGTLWGFSEFLGNPASVLPIPANNDYRDRYVTSDSGYFNWAWENIWPKMSVAYGLNPCRQRIGFWETNYHLAVNRDAGVNREQMAWFYDTIMNALEADLPYEQVLGAAALTAAVAEQYEHIDNEYDDRGFHGNEDFAREIHQLYFGIVGDLDPLGQDNHESVTIKQTARALSGFDFDQSSRNNAELLMDPDRHKPENLDILNTVFTYSGGMTAADRVSQLMPVSVAHPETALNLPVMIIAGLMDDELTEAKKQQIRAAWATMGSKSLLTFLRAYAISTLFHDRARKRYWTSFDRHLIMVNKLALNNSEALRDNTDYDPDGFEAEDVEAFYPAYNVFGGQTPNDAADSAAIFENNYNNVTDEYWRYGSTGCDTCDNNGPWLKDWADVVPANGSGEYVASEVARWLWQHFIGDGWTNYSPLEEAHLVTLLATDRDLPLLLAIREARLGDSRTNNDDVSLPALEGDYGGDDDNDAPNSTFVVKALIAHPYTSADISGTDYISALVAEIGARQLNLEATGPSYHPPDAWIENNNNPDYNTLEEKNFQADLRAQRRIGQAVNFILGTPFVFAQEGR